MATIPDYGDANKRDATFVYHERTFNSMNRINPLRSTPSAYTVSIGKTEFVDAIQLGAVTLDASSRYGFDTYRRHFRLSGPIYLQTLTSVSMQEIVVDYDNSYVSGLDVLDATTNSAVTAIVPTTFNTISTASTDSDFTSISTVDPHSLDVVFKYWPLTPSIVASRYYNGDPIIKTSNTTLGDETSFLMTNSYIGTLQYIDDGSGTAVGSASDALTAAMVYTPPLLVTEAVSVVNQIFSSFTANGGLRASYGFSYNSQTDAVELRVDGGESYQGTTRTEVLGSLTVVPGDLLWYLGFDSMFPVPKFTSVSWDPVSRQRVSQQYVTQAIPRVLRTYQVPVGTFDSSTASTVIEDSANTMYIPVGTSQTIGLIDNGIQYSVSAMLGMHHYSVVVSDLNVMLNGVGSGVYDSSFSTVTGKFVIVNTVSSVFTLDFSSAPRLAQQLGFYPKRYSGQSAYLSDFPAENGLLVDPIESANTQLRRVLSVTTLTNRFQFETADYAPSFWINSVTEVVAPQFSWNTWADATTVTALAVPIASGSLVRVMDTVSTRSYSIVGNDGVSSNMSTVYFGPIMTNTGGLDFANIPFVGMQADRNAFMLHLATLSDGYRFANVDTTGARLVSGAAYGSLFRSLGFGQTSYLGASGTVLAPGVWALDPPDTIYLAVVGPPSSVNATMTPTSDLGNTRAILATLYVGNNFVRISKELQTLLLSSFKTFDQISVEFLEEDGRLVDFHGANHRMSLILRSRGGNVSGGRMG